MKSLKKILALGIAVAMSLTFTAGAVGAANLFTMASGWTLLASTANVFDVTSSGEAQIDATTQAYPGCTKVKVAMYLEYLDSTGHWSTYDNNYWSKTVNGTYVMDSHSRYVPKGNWYRLRTVHTAYKGSSSESDTSISDLHLYNP